LRGGGFAVTLEPLTQAERNLLYAIRSYARFRKIYYVYLAGGADVFNSPYSFAGLNLRGVGPTLAAPSQGYFPTLLLSALERNEAENVRVLEQFGRLYVAFEEGGDVSRLQVDQVEQQLLRSQSSLLQRRLDVNNGLDGLKLQLGVPTTLPLELDDAGTRPLDEHLAQFTRIQREFDRLRADASDYYDAARRQLQLVGGTLTNAVLLEVALRPRLRSLIVEAKAVRGTRFVKNILPRWSVWEKRSEEELKRALLQLGEARRAILNRKAELEVRSEKLPAADVARLDEITLQVNLGRFEQFLRLFEARPWLREVESVRVRQQAGLFREVINLFALVVGEARTERLDKVRKTWPSLPGSVLEGVDLVGGDFDEAIAVAARYSLDHRFELMNARGQLVDSWRQIAVRANLLQGALNVGYNLNATSPFPANEPLNVGGSRTTNQLTINGELPLVRRLEANQYRVSQIAFQRQRRALQATEDFILNDIRTDLRSLRVLGENYKIQQRAVEVAYAQVENSLDVLQAPPDPRAGGNGQTAGNAAALTQQLLNAQTSLLQSQNSLYTVWVNYLVARMQLYRDLELLPLDARGAWTDERTSTDISSDNGGSPAADATSVRIPDAAVLRGIEPASRTVPFADGRADGVFSADRAGPTLGTVPPASIPGRGRYALPERLPVTVLPAVDLRPRFAEDQPAGFDPRAPRGSPQGIGGPVGGLPRR